MSNIGSIALTKYPPTPTNKLWGLIKLEEAPDVCWRPRCGQPLCLVEASRDCELAPGRDEVLRLDTRGQLGLGERCLMPEQTQGVHICTCDFFKFSLTDGVELAVTMCEGVLEGGSWHYHKEERSMEFTLRYQEGEEMDEQVLCVEIRGLSGVLGLTHCDGRDNKQKRTWEEYTPYWA